MTRRSLALPALVLLACTGGAHDSGDASQPSAPDATSAGDASNPSDAAASAQPDAGAAGDPSARDIALAFPASSFFRTDVSAAAKSASSDRAMAALRARGGFGNGDVFQIDFSLDLLQADAASPKQAITPNDGYASPDCDLTPIPLPAGGHVEGEDGYACTGGGDCHLLVWAKHEQRLYEMWTADLSNGLLSGAGVVVWDTQKAVGMTGRGLQCTSADAAGLPIAPLLFNADEVARGSIEHAIRFTLPNDRPQRGFVPPATHGSKTTGPSDAPYYGMHLRLRASYPVDTLKSAGARVVARALQRYGMFHADGGQIALTAQSDRNTTAKWEGLLAPRDLAALKIEDFELIDHGAPVPLTFDCVRNDL